MITLLRLGVNISKTTHSPRHVQHHPSHMGNKVTNSPCLAIYWPSPGPAPSSYTESLTTAIAGKHQSGNVEKEEHRDFHCDLGTHSGKLGAACRLSLRKMWHGESESCSRVDQLQVGSFSALPLKMPNCLGYSYAHSI